MLAANRHGALREAAASGNSEAINAVAALYKNGVPLYVLESLLPPHQELKISSIAKLFSLGLTSFRDEMKNSESVKTTLSKIHNRHDLAFICYEVAYHNLANARTLLNITLEKPGAKPETVLDRIKTALTEPYQLLFAKIADPTFKLTGTLMQLEQKNEVFNHQPQSSTPTLRPSL